MNEKVKNYNDKHIHVERKMYIIDLHQVTQFNCYVITIDRVMFLFYLRDRCPLLYNHYLLNGQLIVSL